MIRDNESNVQCVRYDELAPMLLNEVQQQAAKIRELKSRQVSVLEMQQQLAEMKAAMLDLQPREGRVDVDYHTRVNSLADLNGFDRQLVSGQVVGVHSIGHRANCKKHRSSVQRSEILAQG